MLCGFWPVGGILRAFLRALENRNATGLAEWTNPSRMVAMPAVKRMHWAAGRLLAFALLRFMLVEPACEQPDGAGEVVAQRDEQIDIVVVLAAAEAMRQNCNGLGVAIRCASVCRKGFWVVLAESRRSGQIHME